MISEFYAVGEEYQTLRVAERFGVGDPFRWWQGLSAGERVVLVGFDMIRTVEESRR